MSNAEILNKILDILEEITDGMATSENGRRYLRVSIEDLRDEIDHMSSD